MNTIILLIAISILLESTLMTLPLTLLLVIVAAVIFRTKSIFVLAFLSGLFLDIFSYKTLGISSMIFTSVVLLVYLYERKFETQTVHFVALVSSISALIYLLVNGTHHPIMQAIISMILVSISYLIFQKTNKKVLKYA